MEVVWFFSKENGRKAEEILKKDDEVSRGSIVIREAESLGIEKEGYFIFYTGDEEKVKKAEELIRDLKEDVEEEVLKKAAEKYKEESEKALQGFGGIFG